MMWRPEIDFGTEDAVWIGDALYAKTPAALQTALARLRDIGYRVEDRRATSERYRYTSTDTMELGVNVLWKATRSLPRYAKCDSCSGHNTLAHIQTDGRQCVHCDAILYREVGEGSMVRFSFRSTADQHGSPTLRLKVVRREEACLYFEMPQTTRWINDYPHQWAPTNLDGRPVIRVRYTGNVSVDPIEIHDVVGQRSKYKIVKVLDCVEYDDMDERTPKPEWIGIYEAWHWAPLPSSPTLHEILLGVVRLSGNARAYDEGTEVFSTDIWREIGRFVCHFTSLNSKEWDRCFPSFRTDAQGIVDLAKFCHPDPMFDLR